MDVKSGSQLRRAEDTLWYEKKKREQRRSKRNKLKKALICFKNKHLNSVIQALLVVVL